jgi:hypothetical protein
LSQFNTVAIKGAFCIDQQEDSTIERACQLYNFTNVGIEFRARYFLQWRMFLILIIIIAVRTIGGLEESDGI